MIGFILRSFIAGLSLATPTGPTGALCIKRGLLKKDKSGYITGFGAASADLLFILIVGLGITSVSDFIFKNDVIISIVGGGILISMGTLDWVRKKDYHLNKIRKKTAYWKDYMSGFLATILNPANIIPVFAVYSIIGSRAFSGNFLTLATSILLAFMGSLFGWTLFNFVLVKFRRRIKENSVYIISRITGSILIIFGLLLFVRAIFLH